MKPPEVLVPGEVLVDRHLFLPVLQAGDLGEQVDRLKHLCSQVSEDTAEVCVGVLVQWFFNSPPKSTVKKVIANYMNSVKCEAVAGQLTGRVKETVSQLCGEEGGGRLEVQQLLACLDNCRLGEAGVLAAGEVVLVFLVKVLEEQVEESCREGVSPVARSAALALAGEAMRALVYLLKLDGGGDGGGEIRSLTHRLLATEQLPLDLRSNAGILWVSLGLAAGRQAVEQPLAEILAPEEGSKDFPLANPGSVLSLLHGLLSTYSSPQLEEAERDRQVLASILSCYLLVGRQQEQETATVLGHSRGMLNWAASFLVYCRSTASCSRGVVDQLAGVWEYVWGHLEHPVDSVRHNTRTLLASVVQGLLQGGQEAAVEELLQHTLRLPRDQKGRLVTLSCLVRHHSLARLLELCPSLQEDTLALAGEQVGAREGIC